MKTNILKKIIALSVVLALIVFSPVNTHALPQFRIELLGIVHSDGADRTSWQQEAAYYLNNIDNSVVGRRTAFDNNELLNYLCTSNIFAIHTHGNANTLLAVDSNGNESRLYSSNIASLSTTQLSNLKLAFIGSCSSGAGGRTAENLVNTIFGRGAQCVIGYKGSVYTRANYFMLEAFCSAIGCGYTVSEALAYADARVLAQYGSSGETDNRLIRGDENQSFTDASILLGIADTQEPAVIAMTNSGETVGFFDRSKMTNQITTRISEINTNQPNNESLLDAYQVNTDKYVLCNQYYTEDTGLWTSVYSYVIGGIPTNDSIVFITNGNELVSYLHTNSGAFDHLIISQEFIRLANNQLENDVNEAGIKEYSIVEQRIVMDNGVPEIRFSVQYIKQIADEQIQLIEDFYIAIDGGA